MFTPKNSNMKRLVLLLIVFLSVAFHVNAKNDSTATNSGANSSADSVLRLQNQVLEDSIKHIRDSFGHLGNIMYGSLVVDKADLDSVVTHPELIYQTSQNIHLIKNWVNWCRFILCMLLILGFSFLGFNYAINGGLLRDVAFDENGKLKKPELRPFSFARVQLFWWTMIIMFCYTVSFAITGVLIPINPTMVILLGCGLLVYSGGNIIDNRQINGANKNIDPSDTSINARKTSSRHQDKFDTDTFFADILSDENGISLHRFQAMIFNVMFGVAYVAYFITNMKAQWYPFITFNDWQFAMIGISSAAYLGLKAGENGSNVPANPPGNGGNGGGGAAPAAPVATPAAPVAPVAPVVPATPVAPATTPAVPPADTATPDAPATS